CAHVVRRRVRDARTRADGRAAAAARLAARAGLARGAGGAVTPALLDGVTRRRQQRRGGFLPGLGIGLVFGWFVIYFFGQDTRFAVYGLGGAIMLAFLPSLVRRAGSLERLLFGALLFSYQIDVAIAYSFRPYKPAGPYGY